MGVRWCCSGKKQARLKLRIGAKVDPSWSSATSPRSLIHHSLFPPQYGKKNSNLHINHIRMVISCISPRPNNSAIRLIWPLQACPSVYSLPTGRIHHECPVHHCPVPVSARETQCPAYFRTHAKKPPAPLRLRARDGERQSPSSACLSIYA